jgi:hypothetical protein
LRPVPAAIAFTVAFIVSVRMYIRSLKKYPWAKCPRCKGKGTLSDPLTRSAFGDCPNCQASGRLVRPGIGLVGLFGVQIPTGNPTTGSGSTTTSSPSFVPFAIVGVLLVVLSVVLLRAISDLWSSVGVTTSSPWYPSSDDLSLAVKTVPQTSCCLTGQTVDVRQVSFTVERAPADVPARPCSQPRITPTPAESLPPR